MTKIYDIDSFAGWINEITKISGEPFVKSGQEMINYFFELERTLPDNYGWRYYELNSFKELMKNKKTPNEVNNTYWNDMVRTLEAYGIITYFRTNEILRVAIRSLNNKEIIPAAILTRSLLELASSIIENSNTFLKTAVGLPNKENAIIIEDETFEGLLLRTIWGTRLGQDIPEHLKQKNILTIIQKLSKNPNASQLLNKYEFLCELAHPNVIGNTRFWSDDTKINKDGSVTIVVQKRGYSDSKMEIIENIIWGLGWSATCIRNGYHILQETILEIEKKFPGTLKTLRKA